MATPPSAPSAAHIDGFREFVNADAEEARRQTLLMQDYGYTAQQTPQGPTPTTTYSTSASNGSGCAAKDGKNKFEKQKPRTLSRRNSGEDAKRCRSQTMGNAAVDKMDEEEIIPENEYGKPSVAAPVAQPDLQPVAQGTREQNMAGTDSMDFWARSTPRSRRWAGASIR